MGGEGGAPQPQSKKCTVPIARWYINAVFVSAAGVDGIADHYSGTDSLVYSGKHSVTVTDILFLRSYKYVRMLFKRGTKYKVLQQTS